jgi:CRP-like cAMP-binding protein
MLQVSEFATGVSFSAHIVMNKFLQSLSPFEFDQLRLHLTSVHLRKGAVIHEQNKPIDAVYFIESGLVSRIVKTQTDGSVEMALVGSSGYIGLSVALGTCIALHRTIVLVPGTALRISARHLRDVMTAVPSVREILLRYTHVLCSQNAQISLCGARHSIESRLSRWLLLAHDRVGDDNLPVTHDVLAMLLGVRRSGISTAMQSFEDHGILEKGRGVLKILNRELLQQRSCECYRLIDERSFWQKVPIMHRHSFRAE